MSRWRAPTQTFYRMQLNQNSWKSKSCHIPNVNNIWSLFIFSGKEFRVMRPRKDTDSRDWSWVQIGFLWFWTFNFEWKFLHWIPSCCSSIKSIWASFFELLLSINLHIIFLIYYSLVIKLSDHLPWNMIVKSCFLITETSN